jgi:hypothetical protein
MGLCEFEMVAVMMRLDDIEPEQGSGASELPGSNCSENLTRRAPAEQKEHNAQQIAN